VTGTVEDVFSNFDLVLRAFLLTIELLVVSGIIALIGGTILAALRVGPVPVLAKAAGVYVGIFRNTPLLIIFIFVFFGLPKLDIDSTFFVKGCVALSVYTAAFVCEAIRSGVNSIGLGQAEAARAVGMTFGQTMTQIVLPQAFRAVVPPLASVFIALAKNTSVAAGFGLMEATGRMRFFTNNNVSDRTLIFITFAIGYIIIVELISAGAIGFERRWKVARR
jgi:glutamate transport system permease protein